MRNLILTILVCAVGALAQPSGVAGGAKAAPRCTATKTTNCSPYINASGVSTPASAPTSVCYLTAAIGPTNSATPANVCAGWPILAAKSYALRCMLNITYVASATVGFTLAGPGSPAHWAIRSNGLTGAAAVWEAKNAVGTTSYAAITTGAPGGVTETVIVEASITNGATASGTNLTLTTKGNGANNYNVLADSYCTLIQMN